MSLTQPRRKQEEEERTSLQRIQDLPSDFLQGAANHPIQRLLMGTSNKEFYSFSSEEEYKKALEVLEGNLAYTARASGQLTPGQSRLIARGYDPLARGPQSLTPQSPLGRLTGTDPRGPTYFITAERLTDQERNKQAQGLYQRSSEQLSRARSTATMQQGVNDALQRSIRGARESTESEASAQAGASGTAEVRLGDGDDATARKGIKQGGRAARRPSGTGGFVGKPARGIRI